MTAPSFPKPLLVNRFGKPMYSKAQQEEMRNTPLKKKYGQSFSYRLNDFSDTHSVAFQDLGISLESNKSTSELKAYQEKARLGLIDIINNSGNNFNEAATPEGVAPKPEDFVMMPFRLITSTIVAGGTWRATNFAAKPSALRQSVKLLARKPVYFDHNTSLLNWVGYVVEPFWEGERKTANVPKYGRRGKDERKKWDGVIPAGINGTIAIDTKTNAKLARGVMGGIVFSNSVTILFDWEPSHNEFESEWDFIDAVGTIHEDGKMVTRDVTGVNDYFESSLVWLGADPFAKAIQGDGELTHVDHSSVVQYSKNASEKEKELYKKKKFTVESCVKSTGLLALRRAEEFSYTPEGVASSSEPSEKQNILELMKPEVIALLLTLTGVENEAALENVTEEQMQSALASYTVEGRSTLATAELEALQASATKVEGLTTQVTTLTARTAELEKANTEATAKVTELETAATTNAPLVAFAQAEEAELRSETKRLYGLAASTPDAVIIELIDNADLTQLKALFMQYGSENAARFGATCDSCGSTKISYRKSVEPDNDNASDDTESKDFDFFYDKYK